MSLSNDVSYLVVKFVDFFVILQEKLFLLLLLQRLEEDYKAQILWIIYVKCVYSNVTF